MTLAPTLYRDAIIREQPDPGVLFPFLPEGFLFRVAPSVIEARFTPKTNGTEQPSSRGQDSTPGDRDVLVRLPSISEGDLKIIVLQRWIGRVEQVSADGFVATIMDKTNHMNPPERVEMDFEEVSESDHLLVREGATFYWSVGYRLSIGGQRERVSAVRFARQPQLRDVDVERILAEADRLAAVLQSE